MQAWAGIDSSVKPKFIGWTINHFHQCAEPVYILDPNTEAERLFAVHHKNESSTIGGVIIASIKKINQ